MKRLGPPPNLVEERLPLLIGSAIVAAYIGLPLVSVGSYLLTGSILGLPREFSDAFFWIPLGLLVNSIWSLWTMCRRLKG